MIHVVENYGITTDLCSMGPLIWAGYLQLSKMNVEYPDLLGSLWLTSSDYCPIDILPCVYEDLFTF